MVKILLPYGSSRYLRLLLKQTDAGKHAHSMKDHVMTSKSPGLRVVRRRQGKGPAARS